MDSFLGFEKINKPKRKPKPKFPTQKESWFSIGAFVILALILMAGAKSGFDKELAKHSQALSEYKIINSGRHSAKAGAKIELDFGSENGEIRRFEGPLNGVKDPLASALNEIAVVGQLVIKTNGGQITEINGWGEKRGIWTIYKNGELMKRPINELFIGGGDIYAIRYESR